MSSKVKSIDIYNCVFDLVDKSTENLNSCHKSDFRSFLDFLISLPEKDRKVDFSSNDTVVFLKYFKLVNNIDDIYLLTFSSVKYNNVRNVRDSETLMSNQNKKKQKTEGDEEVTHACIDLRDSQRFLFDYEYNYSGVRKSRMISYLNQMYKTYTESNKPSVCLKFDAEEVINSDFLEALASKESFLSLEITCTHEMLKNTEFEALSGRKDINSDEIKIIFKRDRSLNEKIKKDALKSLYKEYQKGTGLRRIHANSGKNSYIDTNKMKSKVKASVALTTTGEVDSNLIETNFYNIIKER